MSEGDQRRDVAEPVASFRDRLNEAMRVRDMSQAELLRKVKPLCPKYHTKFNKSSMSQYVNGKVENPESEKLGVLSIALNVAEEWLQGYNVPMDRVAEPEIPNPISEVQNPIEIRDDKEVIKEIIEEEIGISKAERILIKAYRAYPWAQKEVCYLLGIIDEVTWANGGTPEDARKAYSEVDLQKAAMIASYKFHH